MESEQKPRRRFRFTTFHSNALFLGAVLAGLQGWILKELNGELLSIFLSGRMDIIATVFSPTAALVWAMKYFSQRPPD